MRIATPASSVLSQWFVTDVAEWVRQVEPPGPGVGTSVSFFGDGTLGLRSRCLHVTCVTTGGAGGGDAYLNWNLNALSFWFAGSSTGLGRLVRYRPHR